MRKIYFLIVFLLIGSIAQAQSIEAIDWPGVVIVDEAENPYEVEIDVTNSSASSVDIRVASVVNSILGGTDYRFCWGPTCYEWTTEDYTSPDNDALIVTLAPGEINSTFYSDYRHNGIEGVTSITYCWFNNADPSDEACYTLDWTLGPVNVSEIQRNAEVSQLSPQPLTGISSFSYNFQGYNNGSVEVYNLMGELVKSIALDNPLGIVMLNADDFESGVYFYSLVADGKKTATRRLIVQ